MKAKKIYEFQRSNDVKKSLGIGTERFKERLENGEMFEEIFAETGFQHQIKLKKNLYALPPDSGGYTYYYEFPNKDRILIAEPGDILYHNNGGLEDWDGFMNDSIDRIFEKTKENFYQPEVIDEDFFKSHPWMWDFIL